MSNLNSNSVKKVLKTIYKSVESSLDNYLFEPNDSYETNEFAIQSCAMAFDAPNFIAVTVKGQRYARINKMDFIEDMRMHFADNPNFIIDGIFEYRLDKPLTYVVRPIKEWIF